MNKLRFHVAGIPHTTKPRETIEGLRRIKELGLDGMELEWVHQVPFDEEKAKEVKKAIEELELSLTVHGSYYINLAALERPKWHASISRIVKAAKVGDVCGAKKLTFHPAFYQGRESREIMKLVEEGILEVKEKLKKDKIDIIISPELTGKSTQFGTLEELVALSKKTKTGFCIDFSHLHARTNGKYNTPEEFKSIFEYVQEHLGKEYLNDMYFHLSGILYGEKGEKRHVCLLESQNEYEKTGILIDGWEDVQLRDVDYVKGGPDIQWKEILHTLKQFKVGGHLVCECPNLEQDCLLLKRYYGNL